MYISNVKRKEIPRPLYAKQTNTVSWNLGIVLN